MTPDLFSRRQTKLGQDTPELLVFLVQEFLAFSAIHVRDIPQSILDFCFPTRAVLSLPPPDPAPTTNSTLLDGFQPCANAGGTPAVATASTRIMRINRLQAVIQVSLQPQLRTRVTRVAVAREPYEARRVGEWRAATTFEVVTVLAARPFDLCSWAINV